MNFVLYVILVSIISEVFAKDGYSTHDLKHYIRKRALEKEGYTHFEFASVSYNFQQDTKKQSLFHSRVLRDTSQQWKDYVLEIQINGDDASYNLQMTPAKTAVKPETRVRVFDTGQENDVTFEHRDCFLVGSLKSSPNESAILSYCDGLKGSFTYGSHSYHVESVDKDGNGVEERIFIARMDIPVVLDTYEPIQRNMSNEESGKRHTRAVLGSLEIETVIILDAEYVSNMRANGHSTNQSLVDLMAFKWAGVQAEWGRTSVLHYDVTISVVEIVIWETNPSWYTPSTVLSNTLLSVCSGINSNGLYPLADHVHLFSGRGGTDVAGKAYTGDICVAGRKCAVSTDTREDEYVIPAHELGHSMGMAHDADVGCPSPNDGIMGSKTASWSTCSVAAMNLLVTQSSAACLTVDNVAGANELTLKEAWPGMVYTDDEICEFHYGPGFRIVSSRTSCSGDRCANLNTSSPSYGVSYSSPTPTDGSYCGNQMVCSSQISGGSYHCISWNDTGLDSGLFTTVTGTWSAWGDQTTCSRTCGTGVQFRQRQCNNPTPQNSAWCEGDEFLATLCNTAACLGDSTVESDLQKQRAAETCARWKTNNVYATIGKVSSNYLSTGGRYGSSGDSQCAVKCDTISGYTADGGERHGFMPDGILCDVSFLTAYEEVNYLPRTSGIYGTCVQGFCLSFGCDDVSGTASKDGCGVCKGNNSTCQIVEGVFDTIIANKERAVIAVLPTGAYRIQFYFTYSSMKYNFLELFSKEDVNVINYRTLTTMDQPVRFANTHWYLLATKQYLYAEGPLDQSVVIKLFNFNNNNNTGVTYAYSIPTSAEMAACSETCLHGTFNATTCSCQCNSGYNGITCSSQCTKICKNNQNATSLLSSCTCDCKGNTYGTLCDCKYPFKGEDCQDCKHTTCQNGGTFNATACRCACPDGYGDLDCSVPCQDAIGNTTKCQIDAASGFCETKNEQMEKDCYMSCGLCNLATTTTSTTSTSTSSTTSSTTTSSTSTTTSTSTSTTSSTTSSTTTSSTSTTTTTPSTSTTTTTPSTSTTTTTPSSTTSTTTTTPSTTTTTTTPSTTTSTTTTTPSTTSTTTTPTTTSSTTTTTPSTTSSTTSTTSSTSTSTSTPSTTSSTTSTKSVPTDSTTSPTTTSRRKGSCKGKKNGNALRK